ncbi:MAG: M48 family metalloprotease [Sedimentisphaerales bacterium]|nr:M48 family metalloprotease [Sedimentisphaerales bacterium]
MNPILEHINSAGYVFVKFASSMLIQSSVLIVILLLLDMVLRKKVRAVFRYWIWMLLLVKLILPASLSSPVSLGNWLGGRLAQVELVSPAIEANAGQTEPILSSAPNVSAAFDRPAEGLSDGQNLLPTKVATADEVQPASVADPIAVSLVRWQGIVFLAWLAVVTALVLLLLQRAIFVRGLIRQPRPANHFINGVFRYCCDRMRASPRLSLKISANATSPAVCGLFRPVILIPSDLGPGLGANGLRAVLLHELAHIKRGDLWVNLAQSILQIVYFYNPLLWLANAVIRRIREQAVDEAVQVAMGEKAQSYPETLVNVAKLAFGRPTLSLRLIGVVESKSALAGRIRHMLNRPIPKTAKLGLIGLLAIIITAAILLPMAKVENQSGPAIAKKVTLPYNVWIADVGIDDVMKILDFASGEIVELSGFKKGIDFIEKVDSMPKGDVYVAYREDINKPLIAFLKGAGLKGEAAKNENSIASPQIMEIPWETMVTTRQGHKYQFSLLSFDKNECIIEYQALNRVAKKTMAKAEKSKETTEVAQQQSDFKATLPNGVIVELIGICEHPSKGKQWWRPDGEVLKDLQYELGGKIIEPTDGYQIRDLIVRIGVDEKNPAVKFMVPGATRTSVGRNVYLNRMNLAGHWEVRFKIASMLDSTDVKVGVASGDWKSVADGFQGPKTRQLNLGEIEWIKMLEENGDVIVYISHNLSDKADTRVTAKDIIDRVYPAYSSECKGNASLMICEYKFHLTREKLKELQFQVRPYEWVEFKNVSLKPNFKTDVEVEVVKSAGQVEKGVKGIADANIDKPKIFTLSDEALMSLDVHGGSTARVLDKRDTPESGVEFDIYFPPGGYSLSYKSSRTSGKGTLTYIDLNKYIGYALKFTLLDIKSSTPNANKARLAVGANIGSPGRYRPAFINFSGNKKPVISSTGFDPAKMRSLDYIGFTTYLLSKEFSNTDGLTATMKIEAVPGAYKIVPQKKVDITPADFDIRLDEKRGVCNLVVSIQNDSDVNIPKFKLRFYQGNPAENLDEAGNVHSGWHEAGPIEPGKSWNEGTGSFHLPDGQYQFHTILDYDNNIAEANETNNQATMKIVIENGHIVEKGIFYRGILEEHPEQQVDTDRILKERLRNLVEEFFKHNYRDITSRKTIEWGNPIIDSKKNMSIRYKYEATIWGKDKIITDQVFVFDKDGKLISYNKISPFAVGSKQWMQERVEDFFKNNYRDITARKTLEWGDPIRDEKDNYSIRYRYEATIWNKDKIIQNKLFTFDKDGNFVRVNDVDDSFEQVEAKQKNSELNLNSPESTVIAFTKAAARGDAAVAMACVAEDSHDREDIKAGLTKIDNPFYRLFKAIDKDSPVQIVSKEMHDDICSIAWKITLKESFSIEGRTFEAGETFVLDGNLKKVDGNWLIVGI